MSVKIIEGHARMISEKERSIRKGNKTLKESSVMGPVLICWIPYTRDMEPIEVASFSNTYEAMDFLFEELSVGDFVEEGWDGTIEELCAAIEENFSGDGSYSITALTIKVPAGYILQV